MKRTKLWWAGLTAEERRELYSLSKRFLIDRGNIFYDSRGIAIRLARRAALIAKANNAVLEHEKSQNENQSV